MLRTALLRPFIPIATRDELANETAQRASIAFISSDHLHEIGNVFVPVIAIVDDQGPDTLYHTINVLDAFPWLSHVLTTSMLSAPNAAEHLSTLLDRLATYPEQSLVGVSGVGRIALLANASRREARFERMRSFFAKQGLSSRLITTLNEIAEELVTNAIYDAPTDAGFFKKAVPRTEDVALPPDRACEISYGIEDNVAFVRVRDTFGALTRGRLMNVLKRCSGGAGVRLDESRGGAGLGMWRIFSCATTIAIAVVPGHLTDILVGIATKDGRPATKHLRAAHLFFTATNDPLEGLIPDEYDLIDHSITLVHVA